MAMIDEYAVAIKTHFRCPRGYSVFIQIHWNDIRKSGEKINEQLHMISIKFFQKVGEFFLQKVTQLETTTAPHFIPRLPQLFM